MRSGLIFGLAALAGLFYVAAPVRAGNLVVNGGFETGNFSGWTTIPTPQGENDVVLQAGFDGVTPHSGNYMAGFGANIPPYEAGISQAILTDPGATYTISYWLANNPGSPVKFDAYWGTTLLSDISTEGAFSFTQFTFTETATTSSTTLLFEGYQPPAYFYLDDVSVTVASVPEPSSVLLALIGMITAGGFIRGRSAERR